MKRQRLILVGVTAAALLGAGGVIASAIQDTPQDAQPTGGSTTADLNRQSAAQAAAADRNTAPAEEAAPAGTPAPSRPVPLTPPTGSAAVAEAAEKRELEKAEDEKAEDADEDEKPRAATPPKTVEEPSKRQRRRTVVVQAIDKVTAETMRFEVEVGGRPVRFNGALIFSAKACEVSAPEEVERDAVAYLEVALQARGTVQPETRQIFRGWMFASTPAVSGLEHPVYDAWVVGCR